METDNIINEKNHHVLLPIQRFMAWRTTQFQKGEDIYGVLHRTNQNSSTSQTYCNSSKVVGQPYNEVFNFGTVANVSRSTFQSL